MHRGYNMFSLCDVTEKELDMRFQRELESAAQQKSGFANKNDISQFLHNFVY